MRSPAQRPPSRSGRQPRPTRSSSTAWRTGAGWRRGRQQRRPAGAMVAGVVLEWPGACGPIVKAKPAKQMVLIPLLPSTARSPGAMLPRLYGAGLPMIRALPAKKIVKAGPPLYSAPVAATLAFCLQREHPWTRLATPRTTLSAWALTSTGPVQPCHLQSQRTMLDTSLTALPPTQQVTRTTNPRLMVPTRTSTAHPW